MTLIEHIWSGTLTLCEGADLPPIAVILGSLLAAPMVCFTTRAGGPSMRAFVSYAGHEVLPSASLADVLFEEFGVEISDQTIVLIQPLCMSDTKTFSSPDLGQSLGQILVELAGLNQAEISVISETLKPGFMIWINFTI